MQGYLCAFALNVVDISERLIDIEALIVEMKREDWYVKWYISRCVHLLV